MDTLCLVSYSGLVPSNEDEFGPVLLSESDTGTTTLTALVMNADHTLYTYTDEMGMEQVVYSSVEILRTDNVE